MSDFLSRTRHRAGDDVASLDAARLASLRETHDARHLPSLFDAWMVLGYARNRSPDTVENYRHACVTAGGLLRSDASVPEIDLWVERLLADGPCGTPLARSSVHSIVCAVRAVAMRAGRALGDLTMADRLHAVDPPRPVERQRVPPPPDALARCLALLPDRADRAMVLVASRVAARRGELLGLRPTDFEAGRRILTIRVQKGRGRRKNERSVSVVLDAETAGELAWCIDHREAMTKAVGRRCEDENRIFPWGLARMNRIIRDLRAGLGADVAHYFGPGDAWHQFRRLAAQAVKDAGGSAMQVAATLGDSPARAAGYYRNDVAQAAPVPSARQVRLPLEPRDVVREGRIRQREADRDRPAKAAAMVAALVDEPGPFDLTAGELDALDEAGRAPVLSVWDVVDEGEGEGEAAPAGQAESLWDRLLREEDEDENEKADTCTFDPFEP